MNTQQLTVMKNHKYCVIMCGGVGSRFWPMSRTQMPKQFLDFFGMGRSLLQMTFDRISSIVPPENILFVTNKSYVGTVAEQVPEVPRKNILAEPARRNTAPCIYWAARHIYAKDPEALMAVLPSDHLILKEDEFREAMERGFEFVSNKDTLLTLGIKPRSPHTGYGYIQAVIGCVDFPDILKVKSFTEKPDLELAKVFVESGEFYWNSGMFVWKAKTIIDAFKALAPDVATVLESDKYGTPAEVAFIEKEFPNCPGISVDYAIMEKAPNVYVKTVDLGWSDLGSWKAYYEVSPKSQDGNVTQNCKAILNNCRDNVIAIKGDKIVVASGLENFIVADNGNALLICPIADEQRIRQFVNEVGSKFGEKYE